MLSCTAGWTATSERATGSNCARAHRWRGIFRPRASPSKMAPSSKVPSISKKPNPRLVSNRSRRRWLPPQLSPPVSLPHHQHRVHCSSPKSSDSLSEVWRDAWLASRLFLEPSGLLVRGSHCRLTLYSRLKKRGRLALASQYPYNG